jgi:hypothetical protein
MGLAACTPQRIDMPVNWRWLNQSWTVTDAAPLAEGLPPPPLGQKYYFGKKLPADDDNGKHCVKANTHDEYAPLSAILGGAETQDFLGRQVPRLSFWCNGRDLTLFAQTHPDLLMTRQGQWLLWLQPSQKIIPVPF